MRVFTGLAAVVLMAASLSSAHSAVAQAASPATALAYEIVSAPTANRGQIVDIKGVRTFTAENGWYTMALGAEGTTELDGDIRFFTYGDENLDNFADVAIVADVITDPDDALSMDDIQSNVAEMLQEDPLFLEDLDITERKILALGDGNGKTPTQVALWIGTDPQMPGTVTVIGGSLLPRGSLLIMIDCNTAAAGEAALRDHFRIAEGALE